MGSAPGNFPPQSDGSSRSSLWAGDPFTFSKADRKAATTFAASPALPTKTVEVMLKVSRDVRPLCLSCAYLRPKVAPASTWRVKTAAAISLLLALDFKRRWGELVNR